MRQHAWWIALALALVAAPAQAQVSRAAICMTQVT
jgi:hypothetical protein